jgi:hypothetical protein
MTSLKVIRFIGVWTMYGSAYYMFGFPGIIWCIGLYWWRAER